MRDKNIALTYEKLFTQEKLSSLATEFQSSKYVPKVMAKQAEIGQEMESSSQPILKNLVTDALNATLSSYRSELSGND
ncbi:hypothetical protein [Pseudomonas violetae]|uniref:Uncharacterized protein n=1 Tax=Pseudomonas violetae TaxID=2915813 RepID=A0ABT0EZ75_9PSED|nr:hypothetical protein [Pseudomonas violetae]MCK1791057.1 hypothetical protein [Pseudomonas violetae]